MFEITNKQKCTGCKMCKSICPVGAISYKVDREGFWYPVVNERVCIDCKKCIRSCPINCDKKAIGYDKSIYSAWTKNDKMRIKSTSGGVFYEFAKEMIRRKGCVVGCRYSDDYKSAYHVIATDMDGVDKLIGSKYFQSDTETIYNKVKEMLENDKYVLFVGTPCQIAAINSFLNKDYEKLYTVDFVCFGINSPKAFRMYLEHREKEAGAPATKVQLKNKNNGWTSLATYIEFKNGKLYLKDKNNDVWINGYIKENLYMRDSCYQCIYRDNHLSDITIGDFWQISRVSQNELFKGISVVMINNKKGDELFSFVKDELVYRKREYQEFIKGNPSEVENPARSNGRDKFFHLLNKYGFDNAVRKCYTSENTKKIKELIKSVEYKFTQGKDVLKQIQEEHAWDIISQRYDIDKIDILQFLRVNYLLKNVVRDKGVFIIPYKNSIIDLHKSAKIIVKNRDVEVGYNKLKKSKVETLVRLAKNAIWISNGGALLFYNTTIDICNCGMLTTGFFSANSGCVIVCAKKILFGENVMLGRNIIIYDSDHHQILDTNNCCINKGREVLIDNNVWLTSNVVILKGTHIEEGCIVGAYTTVSGHIGSNCMVVGDSKGRVVKEKIKWSRKTVR